MAQKLMNVSALWETHTIPGPVRNIGKGTIEISSQAHFYAIELDETSKLKVTHKNVMDGDIEAFIDEKAKVIGTNLLLIDTLNEEENILNRFTKLMKK